MEVWTPVTAPAPQWRTVTSYAPMGTLGTEDRIEKLEVTRRVVPNLIGRIFGVTLLVTEDSYATTRSHLVQRRVNHASTCPTLEGSPPSVRCPTGPVMVISDPAGTIVGATCTPEGCPGQRLRELV